MFFKSIKFALIGLTIFASIQAQAKVVRFKEAFLGTFSQTSMIDFGYYAGQSTFFNSNVTLDTNHEVFNFYPDFFIAAGAFTRADNTGTFYGSFDFGTTLPDYDGQFPPNVLPILGTFNSSVPLNYPNSNVDANTGAYLYAFATGVMMGDIYFDPNGNYANFTIDWSVYTPDPISAVPEPDAVWLFVSGLFCLFALKRKSIIK
jgi:hypothetical protein